MTDPLTALGAAAAAAQFVTLGLVVAKRIRDYYPTHLKMPKSLKAVESRIQAMVAICEEIEHRRDDNETLASFMKDCLARLEDLDAETHRLMPEVSDSKTKRVRKAFMSVAKEQNLLEVMRDLTEATNVLCNLFNVLSDAPILVRSKSVHNFPNTRPTVQRKKILERIEATLRDKTVRDPPVVVLHGAGGEGKSSLAISLCLRQKSIYQTILWMNAHSRQALQLDFAASLAEMTNRRQSIYELEAAYEDLNNALTDRTWLIIFDNYDNPSALPRLRDYFPTKGTGAVLITSRHLEARSLGEGIDIGGMHEEEAIELLLYRTRHDKDDPQTRVIASRITKSMGYLPLAIDQAGAYIGHLNLALQSFDKHYAERRDKIFQRTPSTWDYLKTIQEHDSLKPIPLTVMTTYEMCVDVDNDIQERLLHFLSVAAFMSETSISEALFTCYRMSIGSLSPMDWTSIFCTDDTWDPYLYQEMLAKLANLSLIREFETTTESTFALHPIIRQWLQLRIPPAKRLECIEHAIDILQACVSEGQLKSRRDAEEVISHMDALITHSRPFLVDSPFGTKKFRNPAIKFAQFYSTRGYWTKSITLLETIYSADTKVNPADSHIVLESQCQLAHSYTHHSEYGKARFLLVPLVEAIGNESMEMEEIHLKILDNFATVEAKQDHLDNACKHYTQALEIVDKLGYAFRDDKVFLLTKLAQVRRYMAKHDEALADYQEAIRLAGISTSLNKLRAEVGLADLYRNTANYSLAKNLYLDAVEGFHKLLGANHPETIGAKCNLAVAYRNLEEWQKAEMAFWAAVTSYELVLGAAHVDTLRAKMNLALTYDNQGQIKEANRLYKEVYAGRKEKLGLRHSYTLRTVERLATTMILLGDDLGAENLALETLQADQTVSTKDRDSWANAPERLLALERLFTQALQRDSRKLGVGHVDSIEAKKSLEEVHRMQAGQVVPDVHRIMDEMDNETLAGESDDSNESMIASFHTALEV